MVLEEKDGITRLLDLEMSFYRRVFALRDDPDSVGLIRIMLKDDMGWSEERITEETIELLMASALEKAKNGALG